MRTNSPISDEAPWEEPQPTVIAALPENDFAKVGKGKRYADIDEYIQAKVNFYKNYLPDGGSVLDLTNEQLGVQWKIAAVIISEFESLNAKIQGEANLKKKEQAVENARKNAGV